MHADEQVIERILAGEVQLFEVLMRRHNQRIYRAVRSILREEPEVEDAMQGAYLHAYAHLKEFRGQAAFATWLTRIAIHEAFGRRRKAQRHATEEEVETMEIPAPIRSPEDRAADAEHRRLLAHAIDALPEHFRTVFVLRQVQELSVEETAEVLDLRPETVKTRLHRARALLRRTLLEQMDGALPTALPFEATRCDRVVAGVLAQMDGTGGRN